MRVVLFFSHNVSLVTWALAGMLEREVRFYRRLVEKGVEVIFVTYGDETDYRWQTMWHGISIVPLFAGRRKFRSKTVLWFSTLFLPYRIRSIVPNPDLIKTNQIIGGLLAVQMKLFWHQPLLVRCGYDPYQFALNRNLKGIKSLLLRWYSTIVYRSADRIHVSSDRDATFIRHQYYLKRDCEIEVKPNWVDTDLFRGSTLDNDEFMHSRVLAVGRAVDQKNLQLMIEAIGLGPYGLDIITDDYGQSFLEDSAQQSNADVRIMKRVPHEELPKVYGRYPIYLITSKYEGHPKTLLEAMASGLGVVGTRVPGITQVIDDGLTGLLVEETPSAVQKAIHRLMSDGDLRSRLGRAAREEIRQKYSLDDAVDQEVQTYKNMVNRYRC